MPWTRILSASAVVVSLAGPVGAETGPLTGDGLRAAVAGQTVVIETTVGSFPVAFRNDGTMTGRAPRIAATVGMDRDQGTWWVAKDRLCQRWRNWLSGKQSCFTLRQDGRTVYWRRDDGRSGTATIASK